MNERKSKRSPKQIRLDEKQHAKLMKLAASERRSLTSTLYVVLEEYFKKHGQKQETAA